MALLGDGLDKVMLPHSDLPVASAKMRNNNNNNNNKEKRHL